MVSLRHRRVRPFPNTGVFLTSRRRHSVSAIEVRKFGLMTKFCTIDAVMINLWSHSFPVRVRVNFSCSVIFQWIVRLHAGTERPRRAWFDHVMSSGVCDRIPKATDVSAGQTWMVRTAAPKTRLRMISEGV